MKWQREAVEALVCPLPLREAEKEQLREELWGHLALLYDEELACGAAHAAARESACERLGSGACLARAYATGTTLETRLVHYLTGRTASTVAVVRAFGKASLAFLVLAMASVGLPGMTLATALVSWTTVSMLLVLFFTGGQLVCREARVARALLGQPASWRACSGVVARRLTSAAAVGAATATLTWLAGYALSAILCSALQRMDLLAVVESFGEHVLLRAILLPPIGAALGWLIVWHELQARALPDWPYLNFPKGEA